jgi:hypothetical protein
MPLPLTGQRFQGAQKLFHSGDSAHSGLIPDPRQQSQNKTARNGADSPLVPAEKSPQLRAIVKLGDSHDLAQA